MVAVVAAQAIGQRQVRVGFDAALRILDSLGVGFERVEVPAVPLVVVDVTSEERALLVTVDVEMTPDATYEAVVAGVEGADGAALDPLRSRVRFVGYRSPSAVARRFDLWSMLPKHNRRQDETGDLWRFLSCLQELLDLQLADLDRVTDLFDLERAPEPFLDAILADLGNPFAFELEALGKRRLASVLVEMYRQKGTAPGIKNAIRFFLGLDVEIIPYAGEALVLGESELGVDWILGPSDRFARYAFDVVVDRILADTERRQVRGLVDYSKPAHTHFVNLIEPFPPAFVDHWLLGVSEFGESTDLH